MTEDAHARGGLSLWDLLLVVYLVAPLLVFAVWWQPGVAAALLLAPVCGLALLIGRRSLAMPTAGQAVAGLGLLLVASLWCLALGLGHQTYANEDWLTRDAVLHDLVSQPWPVVYEDAAHQHWLLRAPLGYYLVPAALGRVLALGPAAADGLLAAWTALGAGLLLCGVLQRGRGVAAMAVAVLLLIGFGGLDLIGFRVKQRLWPDAGEHLEWWAAFAQYSSQSTLLAWVPNHALPAWLGLLLIWRHWRQPLLWPLAGPIVAASVLWSPLATVGLAPFLLVGLDWRATPRAWLRRLCLLLPWALPALCAAFYVTDGSQSVPGGWAWKDGRFVSFLGRWVAFMLIEFGVLVLLLRRLRPQPPIFHLAVAVLCALPLLRFGQANDLVMRASIPALLVLALSAGQVFTLPQRPWSRARIAAAVVLVLGSAASLQEFWRSQLKPAWEPAGRGLIEVVHQTNGGVLPPHYVVPVETSRSLRWMRRAPDAPAGGAGH